MRAVLHLNMCCANGPESSESMLIHLGHGASSGSRLILPATPVASPAQPYGLPLLLDRPGNTSPELVHFASGIELQDQQDSN
eukprot:Skav206956  [mRNA]  locus=scaffold6419:67745:67990:+ [translate_table: standard]